MPVVSTQHDADARKILCLAHKVVKVDALASDLLSPNSELGDELSCMTALVCPLQWHLEGAVSRTRTRDTLHAVAHPVDVKGDGLVAHARHGIGDSEDVRSGISRKPRGEGVARVKRKGVDGYRGGYRALLSLTLGVGSRGEYLHVNRPSRGEVGSKVQGVRPRRHIGDDLLQELRCPSTDGQVNSCLNARRSLVVVCRHVSVGVG